MYYGTEILLIFIIVLVAVALTRYVPRILTTLSWSISGEAGGLLARGFAPRSVRVRRTAELRSAVSQVAMIARLNLPLAAGLRVSADGERGAARRQLLELSRLIACGTPVWESFETVFASCPAQVVAVLRHGESCGRLPHALTDLERSLAATVDRYTGRTDYAGHAAAYFALVMVTACVVVACVMYYIIPKFREIFSDFAVTLPSITNALLSFSQWFVMTGWMFLLLLLVVLTACALVGVLARGRNDGGPISNLVARVRWTVPFTRTVDSGLGMARAIRSLAIAVGTGSFAAHASDISSVVSSTNGLRPRLNQFGRDVQAGVLPHEAARRAALGDVFVSALRMIERGEDAEAALAHAADYYEAIAERWWHALAAVSVPAVTLMLGGVIGFIVLALFLPLVCLIEAVSGSL